MEKNGTPCDYEYTHTDNPLLQQNSTKKLKIATLGRREGEENGPPL